MLKSALGYLAAADATAMAAETQTRCLRMLEQAHAVGTAARTSVLAAFTAGQGYSADGDYSPRAWLNRTRITKGAAAGYTGWVRRAAAHPGVIAAMAAEEMSESFARMICSWTDKLPEQCRPDADEILLAAARAGMGLPELAGLAGEICARSRSANPDDDQDTAFEDRAVRLETTFDGAGVLHGDLGFSGFKEITRDGFGELIAAIEAGQVDVVIVRDIDRLTRNLTDWNAFEKVCVRHGVRLSAYTGGDLDLSTAEGAYYGGMETLRARRESAVKSARVREAQDREARRGRRLSGGQWWFGYTRMYANPDEPNPKKRHILREEINPVEADAIRDAAVRVLEHGESVGSIVRDWTARGIKPVAAKQWWPTSIVGTLTSARLAGLLEWQGKKYPATQWPAIIDVDTHERLVKLFADPARRKHVVRAPAHLLSGIATCPKCGRGLHYRRYGSAARIRMRALLAQPGAAGPRSRRGCWRNT